MPESELHDPSRPSDALCLGPRKKPSVSLFCISVVTLTISSVALQIHLCIMVVILAGLFMPSVMLMLWSRTVFWGWENWLTSLKKVLPHSMFLHQIVSLLVLRLFVHYSCQGETRTSSVHSTTQGCPWTGGTPNDRDRRGYSFHRNNGKQDDWVVSLMSKTWFLSSCRKAHQVRDRMIPKASSRQS